MTKQLSYELKWWTLINNDQAVQQAMIDLYNLQTKDEQGCHKTTHANSKGFSSAHAKVGSMYAEEIIKGHPLTQEQIESARKIALHYVKQIVDFQPKSN